MRWIGIGSRGCKSAVLLSSGDGATGTTGTTGTTTGRGADGGCGWGTVLPSPANSSRSGSADSTGRCPPRAPMGSVGGSRSNTGGKRGRFARSRRNAAASGSRATVTSSSRRASARGLATDTATPGTVAAAESSAPNGARGGRGGPTGPWGTPKEENFHARVSMDTPLIPPRPMRRVAPVPCRSPNTPPEASPPPHDGPHPRDDLPTLPTHPSRCTTLRDTREA
jgi:hypothetical protein